MSKLKGKHVAGAGILCVAVLVCFANHAGASQSGYAVQPGMTRMLLSMAGVETESVALFRDDAVSRAIRIPNVQGNEILIGFPDGGIRRGVPFLLAINGEELMVKATGAGQLTVLEGDPSVLPADIGDFIECLVNNIGDLVRAILELDIGGIIGNVFQIVGCIFTIL